MATFKKKIAQNVERSTLEIDYMTFAKICSDCNIMVCPLQRRAPYSR